MRQRSDAPDDMPPTHGLGLADLWRRIQVAQRSEPREKVGFWLGLLLLFAPVFYFLLYFKRYSAFARIGWGLWLGFIVFVKVFGLSDAVIHIDTPHQGAALPPNDPTELPLKTYLGKLLGSQYMDFYRIDGDKLVITYERHDGYFGNDEVLADLAISNGFSLLYRRDIDDLRLRFPIANRWREAHITRRGYREFFGVTEAAMRGYADPGRAKQSPAYNVTEAEKARFLRTFVADIPAPTGGRPTEPPTDPRTLIQPVEKR